MNNEARRDDETGVIHGSFRVVRSLAAPPDRVFAAYADLRLRRQWFRIPGRPHDAQHELDFRVGGRELLRGTVAASGTAELIEYRSQFFDIALDERIVLVYELVLDGQRRSISLLTSELAPESGGTRLTLTEQYVFVAVTGSGRDIGEREGGTRLQLNGLARLVEQLPPGH
jgi:uncharacterized protein YndB with AHSA1/START domain